MKGLLYTTILMSQVVFIRLQGFQEMIYRIAVDDIRYYTDVYPPDPAGNYLCEITFRNGNLLQVRHSCDDVDLNIANSLRSNTQ